MGVNTLFLYNYIIIIIIVIVIVIVIIIIIIFFFLFFLFFFYFLLFFFFKRSKCSVGRLMGNFIVPRIPVCSIYVCRMFITRRVHGRFYESS